MSGSHEGEGEIRLGRLDQFMGFQLRRIQNQLSRDFAAATADHEMRSGFFSTLALISANPGISQAETSHAVGLDKSVTVQIIDDMERRGFAERRRAPDDRRRHSLYTTEAGERFLDELFATLRKTEAAVLKQITKDELALLHSVFNRMYAVYSPKRSSR